MVKRFNRGDSFERRDSDRKDSGRRSFGGRDRFERRGRDSERPRMHEVICDKCGEKLFQREDDVDEIAINKRFETYRDETLPVFEHYKNKLIKVDGSGSIEEVARKILEVLNSSL